MLYLDMVAIARRLGVARSTVRAYRHHGLLPEPDRFEGRVPLWLPETIAAWAAARDRTAATSDETSAIGHVSSDVAGAQISSA